MHHDLHMLHSNVKKINSFIFIENAGWTLDWSHAGIYIKWRRGRICIHWHKESWLHVYRYKSHWEVECEHTSICRHRREAAWDAKCYALMVMCQRIGNRNPSTAINMRTERVNLCNILSRMRVRRNLIPVIPSIGENFVKIRQWQFSSLTIQWNFCILFCRTQFARREI